jgi:hypothetical protein
MTRRQGVSPFVATMVLVSISLSLSYVVYGAVSEMEPSQPAVFVDQVRDMGGPVGLLQVVINTSEPESPQALEIDGANSAMGVLYFDGVGYNTTGHLCLADGTTFFSVHTRSGILSAEADGAMWIDGYRTSSLDVAAGWHELVFSDASDCNVTAPGGLQISFQGPDLSTAPFVGQDPSTGITVYLPSDGSEPSSLMVFSGGIDTIA